MLRRLRERTQSEQGFTLIELLVVILIIGILAAIAIPSFLNQRGKGNDAEAKSVVVTSAEAMETCATDNNGSYLAANCDRAALIAIEPTLTDATTPTDRLAVGSTSTVYGIGVASDRDTPVLPTVTNADPPVFNTPATGVQFRLVRSGNGATARTCYLASGSSGGCTNVSANVGGW